MKSVFVVILCFLGTIGSGHGTLPCYNEGRKRFGSVGNPGTKLVNTDGVYDNWIVQYLDNFDSSNNATWWNRYFVNEQFYRGNDSPIFLMLRGEDSGSKGFMVAGAWIDYAKRYNAMLFQLEHRFYGLSIPTDNLTVSSLQYLTSQQALADAANFIQAMTYLYSFNDNQKWIVFGGSYAGSMAIWLVEKYPHLVFGAISSSGPVNQIVDFEEYLNGVTSGLDSYSYGCGQAVNTSFSTIQSILEQGNGAKYLNKKLKVCDSLENATNADISNLFYTLTGDFMEAVQYNGINSQNAYVNISLVCRTLLNNSLGSLLTRLQQVNSMYLIEQYERCVDFKYDKMIRQLRNTSIYAPASYGDRQWFYQTCNEFGFFQTTDGNCQVFGKTFPLNYLLNQCTEIFGPMFNRSIIDKKVQETKSYYGSIYPNVENVLSVQGSIDPWHTRGIYKNYTETGGVRAIYIPGTAHCADMYDASPLDPPQLTEARNIIMEYLGKILQK